jgi:hypothetical protein
VTSILSQIAALACGCRFHITHCHKYDGDNETLRVEFPSVLNLLLQFALSVALAIPRNYKLAVVLFL